MDIEVMNIAEVTATVNLSEGTVRNLVKAGVFPEPVPAMLT